MSLKKETPSDIQLHLAALHGDENLLKKVLDSGKVHVDCKDEDDTTPLILASASGHLTCVVELLEQGANPNSKRVTGTTALFFASQGGFTDVVRILLKSGAIIDSPSLEGGTALFVACQGGHINIVKELLNRGANVHVAMKDRATALFIASQNGHRTILSMLLTEGANPNACRNDGATPLWIASQMGHDHIVRLLLQHGANIDAVRCDGATPIFKASQSCASRKSSLDSEISVSVRHYSVESRRNSVDSQVSVKIAEVQTKVARRTHGTVKSKIRGRRRDFNATRKHFRRESSTSVESQIITAMKKTSYPSSHGFFTSKDKSLKRRCGGNIEANDITHFLNSVLQNQGMGATSDDDNVSRTSVKIQDSRLDFVMRQDMRVSDDEFGSRQKYARSDDEPERKMYPSLQDVLNATNVDSTNNSLKSSKERADGDRNSKNSMRSAKSRKSSRPNSRRLKKGSKNPPKATTKRDVAGQFSGLDDSSFASYSSGLEIPTGVQSSYSGVSLGKTHSRNSKTSCDVGTQANSYEIETQTQLTDEYDTANRKAERDAKENHGKSSAVDTKQEEGISNWFEERHSDDE